MLAIVALLLACPTPVEEAAALGAGSPPAAAPGEPSAGPEGPGGAFAPEGPAEPPADPAPTADGAPPAEPEPSPEVMLTAADGSPIISRYPAEGCDWEVRPGDGASSDGAVVVPGYPRAAASRGGALVVWVTCEGEQLDGLWVVSELSDLASDRRPASLSPKLPEFVEAAWWRDRDTVIIQGRELGDAISSVHAFTLSDAGVTPAPDPCVSITPGEDQVTRDGQPAPLLLRDDLDDDDLDELVIEEPDSCGTGSCMASVWTRCPAEGRWRKLGDMYHRDGVTSLPETHQGWKILESRRDTQVDRWHWNGQGYVRVR